MSHMMWADVLLRRASSLRRPVDPTLVKGVAHDASLISVWPWTTFWSMLCIIYNNMHVSIKCAAVNKKVLLVVPSYTFGETWRCVAGVQVVLSQNCHFQTPENLVVEIFFLQPWTNAGWSWLFLFSLNSIPWQITDIALRKLESLQHCWVTFKYGPCARLCIHIV